jgi:hypothetical protein
LAVLLAQHVAGRAPDEGEVRLLFVHAAKC